MNQVKILHVANVADLRLVVSDKADVVEIASPVSAGFGRYPKIYWLLRLDGRLPADYLRSPKDQKRYLSDLRLAAKSGIKITQSMAVDEKTFSDWLNLYRQILSDKKVGLKHINWNWYRRRSRQAPIFQTAAFQNKQLLGGILWTIQGRSLRVAGTACRHIKIPGGVRLPLEISLIAQAQNRNLTAIKHGRDLNLYGPYLNPGLFEYKSRLGYSPYPVPGQKPLSTFFLSFDNFIFDCLFLAGKPPFDLYFVPLKLSPPINLNRFSAATVDRMEIVDPRQLIQSHRFALQKLISAGV